MAWQADPAAAAPANTSALYDPATVTMTEGTVYTFTAGTPAGAGRKWHSVYSFRRAAIIGTATK